MYAWLWYHVEFWLKPEDRRPFTFIIRDFYHCSPAIVLFLSGLVGYVFGKYLFDWEQVLLGAGLFTLGHLFWSKPYVPGEQEWPPYTPDAPDCKE